MSADIMLICKDKGEEYNGNNTNKCLYIGDTAYLEDYAILIQHHASGTVDTEMIDKIDGIMKLYKIEQSEYEEILKWLIEHRGEYISYEAW